VLKFEIDSRMMIMECPSPQKHTTTADAMLNYNLICRVWCFSRSCSLI